MAEYRDSATGKIAPQQIAEAERLAREWKPKTWDELKANPDVEPGCQLTVRHVDGPARRAAQRGEQEVFQ